MSAIVNSPLGLAAVAIALLALAIGAGVTLRGRSGVREAWRTVLGVVALCALAIVAVAQGLAR